MMRQSKILCVCLCMMMAQACFTGCTNQAAYDGGHVTDPEENGTGTYENLDLSETVFTENAPESGEWKTMEMHTLEIDPETAVLLQEAAEAYGGYALDTEDIVCEVRPSMEEWFDVSYAEMTNEAYGSDPYIIYMRYVGDDFYIDTNTSGKIELYNRSELKEILGIEYNKTWSWSPQGDGTVVKSYDLQDEAGLDDTYCLNHADVSLRDAMTYATEFLNSGNLSHLCPGSCTFAPYYADVYKFSDDLYGYYFWYQVIYDGVPLDATQGVIASNADEEQGGSIISNSIKLLMLTDSSAVYMWTCSFNENKPSTQEGCELTVDYEQACQIVSETLSRNHLFHVNSAELLYCMMDPSGQPPLGDYIVMLRPMWQFKITDVGVQEYSIIYVNVDAVNGEVYLRYE